GLGAIRRRTGSDLGALLWGGGRLESDPAAAAAVLWALCEPHAAPGTTEDEFLAGIDAPAAAAAWAALVDAVNEFLPGPDGGPADPPAPDAGTPDLERACWELAGVAGLDPRGL